MSETVQEFITAMRNAGVGPSSADDIIADDAARYYHVDGDKPRTKKGSYRLSDDDGFGFGWFYNHRTGENTNWHSKSKRKLSDDDKAEYKARLAASKKRREEQRKEDGIAAQAEAATIWARSDRTGTSSYLERKGVVLRGVRYDGGNVVVPIWRDGVMVAVQQIMPDGFKLFLKGSDHMGGYFSIKGSMDTIAICEGVSTAASVSMATGWSVIASFNAANLKAVAVAIRAKYPDARIVIAGDNDHEATDGKGQPLNIGRDKAGQAAVAIGGAQVLLPPDAAGVSDWNDVHIMDGIDAVRDALLSAPVAIATQPDDSGDQWEPDYGDDDGDVIDVDPWGEIRPLGHNRGAYYFFPRSTGQIMEFSATSLGRPQNLFQLARRGFWERMYAPEEKMGTICEYASADLIAECHNRGIFSVENARGVGVWRDGKALLVNCGDVIVGEGVKCHPSEYDGDYVYEAGQRVIDMEAMPLSNAEASKFRDICGNLTWKKPQYGDFLAGWVVISAVGGCVDWRPHIFVTGRKGSGKSTVMDKIVRDALKGIAVKRDGGTTEPGIRKALGASSRPFIMDEAEAESAQRRAQLQLILEYFRNASSGAVVENANATYVARSAACFGAINPRIDQGADADRWSMLELEPNNKPDSEAHYKRLLSDIDTVITDDFPHRLLARTVANLNVLLANISVFISVFSKKLGSKRAGDQVGTLLAGAYSLVSDKRVTYDFVDEWVSNQDWNWSELTGGGSDADALVQHIMAARVRYDHDGMGRESSIGELIWRASTPGALGSDDAARGLGGVGVKVDGDRIVISNTASPLKRILNDTPWGVWKRTLGDYEGAEGVGQTYFGPGVKTRATSIPLAALGLDDVVVADGWDMEGFENG